MNPKREAALTASTAPPSWLKLGGNSKSRAGSEPNR
jgi:hypothetical protein